ncbi:hypothetical protein UFOVP860_71 [uncultured Caudovirales phage]|uniref:Uncharacterized protein n=1 Tax=uncultured Caudovirales phage TaxID=2100421 RepID=A0A6J5PA13_9CAUD|nr:hypothetical protein UFOVP860_71 [uncultured Caudovirales phage]CAB4195524.1 hypothetical protein UFOVP1293_40 [uncultured Caudovirales phage]CAB4222540.1 hypothetical protein UFOVP1644_58 [uncultured Caudovirales phage]
METVIEATPAPEPWKILPEGEYAIVELMGHTTLIGRISEVEKFGTKMLAMEPLFNGALLGVVFQGGSAIYRMTPCSREVAWAKQPKQPYQLPGPILATVPAAALPAPAKDVVVEHDYDDDEQRPF